MRERVALLAARDGGFQVTARLPLHALPAAEVAAG
jgi:hypothetical protein